VVTSTYFTKLPRIKVTQFQTEQRQIRYNTQREAERQREVFTIRGASLTLSSGSRHVKDANHLRETTIESLTVTTEHDAVSTRQLILNNTQQLTYNNTSTLNTTCRRGLNHVTLAPISKLGMKRVLTQFKRGQQTCASLYLILYTTGSQLL